MRFNSLIQMLVSLMILGGCSPSGDSIRLSQSGPSRAPASEGCVPAQRLSFESVEVIARSSRGLTEGLLFENGFLYESTGKISGHGPSSFNRIDPSTGEVLVLAPTPDQDFGEGLVKLGASFFQLTYRDGKIHEYGSDGSSAGTFLKRSWNLPLREGWGLTTDGVVLYATDGSEWLYRLDPASMKVLDRVGVRDSQGREIRGLNELEWVNGQIYAHIFPTAQIVRIDPVTGCKTGEADLSRLSAPFRCPNESLECDNQSVVNGTAFDPSTGFFYITGKSWPFLYRGRFSGPR